MMIALVLRIGLKKGYNLKKVYELGGLMMLWLTISEGVVLVVVVFLGYLAHMRFAWYLGICCWNVHW